jgi:hypothetical protein
MRHEFTHVEGWKKWYDSVKEGKNEVMLNFFKELRNTSVKKDPLDTYHEIEVIIPRELTNDLKATLDSILGKSGTLILATANETIPELEGIEYVFSKVSSISVKRQVKGRSTDKDIVVACTEYYNFLKSTVRDCLSRFENKLQSKSNT